MGNSAAVQQHSRRVGKTDERHDDEAAIVQNQSMPVAGLARLAEAKAKFMKNKGKQETINSKIQTHGTNFIKEMYHRLDPSISLPNAIDITGEIQIAVKYNKEEKLLLLKLIQARQLVSRDLIGCSDPYAVVKVIPDRYNEGAKRTRKKLRTVNPVFNEIFSFALEEEEIPQTKISIDLFDHDIVGTDDFMGQAIVDISKINLLNELTHNEWFMLQQETDFSVTGEIEVTLYHEHDTLYITIHKAKDLLPMNRSSGEHGAFISVNIPFTTQNKETKIARNQVDPEFEETLEFDLLLEDIHQRTIVFHIYYINEEKTENHVGDVTINLKRYRPGECSRKWYRVSDLRNTARERTQLGESAVAQEFREAMFAHTLYHCPTFMFETTRCGKKMYTMICRQAAASSKMVLVNGTPLR